MCIRGEGVESPSGLWPGTALVQMRACALGHARAPGWGLLARLAGVGNGPTSHYWHVRRVGDVPGMLRFSASVGTRPIDGDMRQYGASGEGLEPTIHI